MNIDRISYSESHELFAAYNLKQWKKIGLEASLAPGDSPEEALKELKHKIKELLTPELVPIEDALPKDDYGIDRNGYSPEDKRIYAIIKDIESVTAIDQRTNLGVQTGLIAYQSAADSHYLIKVAYDLKMLQLKK